MHLSRYPLSKFMRTRAEAFFGTDFSAVTIQVGPAPERLGTLAFAYRDTIHLAPRATRLDPIRAAEILGHELTHIVQQRQGRVVARHTAFGHPLSCDAALEAEAVELGHRFVHRPWHRPAWHRRGAAGADRGHPAIQGLITVGGEPLPRVSALSPAAQQVLKFIVDGQNWLEWAIDNPEFQHASTDEPRLLAEVQSGLHGAPTTLLRRMGLLIGPIKLMTLSLDQLQTLAAVEAGQGNAALDQNVGQIVAEHQLRTANMLAQGSTFLSTLGVAQEPVFQTMGLEERIAIYELMQSAQSATDISSDVQTEAANAAVVLAQDAFEFVDYFTSYVVTAFNHHALNDTSKQRQALFEAALASLTPLFYDALSCPMIGNLASLDTVTRSLQSWYSAGYPLGFARISDGIRQIIEYTDFRDQTGEAARTLVGDYLRATQQLLTTSKPTAAIIGQNGRSCRYLVGSAKADAELLLQNGMLSQGALRFKSTPATTQPASLPARPASPASAPSLPLGGLGAGAATNPRGAPANAPAPRPTTST